MAYQVVAKADGGTGPLVEFSSDGGSLYLKIGAWNGQNYIVSGGRPLVIEISNGMKIEGLTTAPAGTATRDLVVDDDGNVYKQS